MTSRRSLLIVLAWFATACGGDAVHHLPDAPPFGGDAASDAGTDAGPDQVGLHVSLAGTGSGTITSSPAGITCGIACDAQFTRGTVITLTAEPATGSVFAGWTGACAGAPNPTCEVTLGDAATTTATFNLAKFTVTVTKAGAGTGTVSGGAVACGATCTTIVDYGTALTLAATAGALSTFAGWGGACSGTATCALTITSDTTVTANFALNDVTLFVSLGGNGAGRVTSNPAAIDCGTTCQKTYTAGQMTTLSAVPATGSTFTGWSGGGCTGTAPCTLTMTVATTVTATFTLDTFLLTVVRAGNGSGAVTSAPAGIACGTDCTELYNFGTSVTLTPAASTGSTFTGWTGACTGTGPCTIAITQAATATATFTLDQHPLTVSRLGTGSGTVTGPGIACGTTCMTLVDHGTMVTLTAAAATGSTFAGWGGACTGTGSCVVTMDMARTVMATFTLDTHPLTVSKLGTGSGTVTGGGINCGTTCSATLNFGTMVTLTATPNAADSFFAGWGGACTGTGTCTVTMDAAKSVTATFTLNSYTLTVTKSGAGSGVVAGGAINCGTTCSQTATHGTMVTLTATPATGSTFGGWGGACTGTGSCTVTMDMAKTVTAAFAQQTFPLTVTKQGSGTVAGGGINCGSTCAVQVVFGTMVTLTATPTTGSSFGGWGGACTGTGSCTVTMDMARSVTATFTLDVTLTVVKGANDTGTGTVTGTGINCGSTCSTGVPPGTMVTLTATPSVVPATASTFTGWSGGGCSGTLPTCTVTVSTATTVTASFTLSPNIFFVTSTMQTGNLGDLSGADSICKARAQAVNLPGTYVAYLSSLNANTIINAPSRVGGATGWVRPDGKPVMNDISQMSAGTLFNPPSVTETKVDITQSNFQLAWTGTSTSGTFANQCLPASGAQMPWGGTSGTANMGLATSTMANVIATDATGCGATFRLYCLGIDRKAVAQ